MDWVVVSTVAEVIAALATAAAVGWAAFEFHRRRVADDDARAAELEAVTMSFRLLKPPPSTAPREAAEYDYEFIVHNPGRLPITNVTVEVTYPESVQRLYGPERQPGKQRQVHDMYTPVVASHGRHAWSRRLLVPEDVQPRLRDTTATISFVTTDAGRLQVAWPHPERQPSSALRRRLDPSLLRD